MKLAIVTTSYPSHPGDPAGHFVETEARCLVREGHEVFVLSPVSSPWREGDPHHVRVSGAPLFGWPGAIERFRANPWKASYALAFVSSVRRALRRLAPLDQIRAHWIVPSAWPAALGRVPLSIVAHGSDVRLLQRMPRVAARAILADLIQRGATFQCVSHALREDLVELYPKLGERTSVAPCSLDVQGVPNREQARQVLGVTAQRLIAIVGRLIRTKRTHLAISAASLVPDAHVVVIGDGPELPALRSAFPTITFLGRLPRELTLTWISAANVLISASRDEGAPTVVREALALGTEVVAAPSGDLSAWAKTQPLLWVTRGAPSCATGHGA